MSVVFSKAKIESEIVDRFGETFKVQKKPVDFLGTGVKEVDELVGGVPRGAITEIHGSTSSGRTSLMFSMLAHASTHDEICAVVDTDNTFAPTAAVESGINFDGLLWVRCNSNIEHAFKATDLLLNAGGFGLVILDMGDVAGKDARRIISSWWYRFRRTVENKATAVVVITQEAATRSCAALTLELNGAAEWSSSKPLEPGSLLLEGGSKSFGPGIPAKENIPRLPDRFSIGSVKVPHANLLRMNSIKVSKRRPITPGVNESGFHAQNYF